MLECQNIEAADEEEDSVGASADFGVAGSRSRSSLRCLAAICNFVP